LLPGFDLLPRVVADITMPSGFWEKWKYPSMAPWEYTGKGAIGASILDGAEHAIVIQSHIKEPESIPESNFSDDIKCVTLKPMLHINGMA
jgi:hypothetical protein